MKNRTHYILHAISVALIALLLYSIFSSPSNQEFEQLKSEHERLGYFKAKSEEATNEWREKYTKLFGTARKWEEAYQREVKLNFKLKHELKSIKHEIYMLDSATASDSARREVSRYIAEFNL